MRRSIYVFMLVLLVVSFLVGCGGNNPAGPGDSAPDPSNPAPGFQISNLRYVVVRQGTAGAGVSGISFDYKGAQGGISEVIGKVSYWDSVPIEGEGTGGGPLSGGQGANGHVYMEGYGYDIPGAANGSYTFQIYVKDKSGRESNMLSSPFTINFF